MGTLHLTFLWASAWSCGSSILERLASPPPMLPSAFEISQRKYRHSLPVPTYFEPHGEHGSQTTFLILSYLADYNGFICSSWLPWWARRISSSRPGTCYSLHRTHTIPNPFRSGGTYQYLPQYKTVYELEVLGEKGLDQLASIDLALSHN